MSKQSSIFAVPFGFFLSKNHASAECGVLEDRENTDNRLHQHDRWNGVTTEPTEQKGNAAKRIKFGEGSREILE